MKTCTGCKEKKELCSFGKKGGASNSLRSRCKRCRAADYKLNASFVKTRSLADYVKNKPRKLEQMAEWKRKNPDRVRALNASWNEKNCDKRIKDSRAWYANNKQRAKITRDAYYQTNKARIIKASSEYRKARLLTDPFFKLKTNLRTLIGNSIRKGGYKKNSKTCLLLGANFEAVRDHLHSTYRERYGRDYNGEVVEIDHIIPCCSVKTENELISLQRYTNLQLLSPSDHKVKTARDLLCLMKKN
jgi:hypothetical protein